MTLPPKVAYPTSRLAANDDSTDRIRHRLLLLITSKSMLSLRFFILRSLCILAALEDSYRLPWSLWFLFLLSSTSSFSLHMTFDLYQWEVVAIKFGNQMLNLLVLLLMWYVAFSSFTKFRGWIDSYYNIGILWRSVTHIREKTWKRIEYYIYPCWSPKYVVQDIRPLRAVIYKFSALNKDITRRLGNVGRLCCSDPRKGLHLWSAATIQALL